MGWGFWAGLALFAGLAYFILRVARRSGDHAALEEREAWERANREALQAAVEKDREVLGRMADADAAAVSEPADRIRERLRGRDPKTR